MLICFNGNTVLIRGVFFYIVTMLATKDFPTSSLKSKFHPTGWNPSREVLSQSYCVIYLYSLFGSLCLVADTFFILSWSRVSDQYLWLGILAGYCAYIDAENAFNTSFAEEVGVDIDKLLIAQPDSAENSLSIVNTLVGGSIDVVVVDSVCYFTIPFSDIFCFLYLILSTLL